MHRDPMSQKHIPGVYRYESIARLVENVIEMIPAGRPLPYVFNLQNNVVEISCESVLIQYVLLNEYLRFDASFELVANRSGQVTIRKDYRSQLKTVLHPFEIAVAQGALRNVRDQLRAAVIECASTDH